jgi:hypothetical protein
MQDGGGTFAAVFIFLGRPRQDGPGKEDFSRWRKWLFESESTVLAISPQVGWPPSFKRDFSVVGSVRCATAFCPAGRAHCAWGGHSMAFFLFADRLLV